MKIKKQNTGISLMVLVITILVLSILAGAIIISLSGTDIISWATDAVDKNNEASLNDKNSLLEAEDIIEETSGIKVEKTTDTAPGVLEGSGSEEDPYVINSIEDLIFFAYDVKNGNNYSRKNS